MYTPKFIHKLLILAVFCTFLCVSQIYAQTSVNLPSPKTVVATNQVFTPATIKGITINPNNPLELDFIIYPGDDDLQGNALREESNKLIKYFLAALTVPKEEMWVNLSPYEKERIIPSSFKQTLMGRDLLIQDYYLKQLTASVTNPDTEVGQRFWNKIKKEAYEKHGLTDIPINMFHKVWIIPDKADVYVHESTVFIMNRHLRVLLESDYMAHAKKEALELNSNTEESTKALKEIIIPIIEREVNYGKTFSNLHQIYDAAILATWFKANLKQSFLGKSYIDKRKTVGVGHKEGDVHLEIYDQYVKTFEEGVYNFIKEDYDPVSQEVIAQNYFSGGIDYAQLAPKTKRSKTFQPQKVVIAKTRVADPSQGVTLYERVVDITGDEIKTARSSWEGVGSEGNLLKEKIVQLTEGIAIEWTHEFTEEDINKRMDVIREFNRQRLAKIAARKEADRIRHLLLGGVTMPYQPSPEVIERETNKRSYATEPFHKILRETQMNIHDSYLLTGGVSHGPSKFKVTQNEEEVIIEYFNNGIGLNEEPIYDDAVLNDQNVPLYTRKLGGDGLGTDWAKLLLKLHGGGTYTLEESRDPDYKTVARIVVPADAVKIIVRDPEVGEESPDEDLAQGTTLYETVVEVTGDDIRNGLLDRKISRLTKDIKIEFNRQLTDEELKTNREDIEEMFYDEFKMEAKNDGADYLGRLINNHLFDWFMRYMMRNLERKMHDDYLAVSDKSGGISKFKVTQNEEEVVIEYFSNGVGLAEKPNFDGEDINGVPFLDKRKRVNYDKGLSAYQKSAQFKGGVYTKEELERDEFLLKMYGGSYTTEASDDPEYKTVMRITVPIDVVKVKAPKQKKKGKAPSDSVQGEIIYERSVEITDNDIRGSDNGLKHKIYGLNKGITIEWAREPHHFGGGVMKEIEELDRLRMNAINRVEDISVLTDPSTGEEISVESFVLGREGTTSQPFSKIMSETEMNMHDAYLFTGGISDGPSKLRVIRNGENIIVEYFNNGVGLNEEKDWDGKGLNERTLIERSEGGHGNGLKWSKILARIHGGSYTLEESNDPEYKTVARIVVPADAVNITVHDDKKKVKKNKKSKKDKKDKSKKQKKVMAKKSPEGDSAQSVGGIDLNPDYMNIRQQDSGMMVEWSFDPNTLPTTINSLTPVIINISSPFNISSLIE